MEAFLRGSRSADPPPFKRPRGAVALLYTLALTLNFAANPLTAQDRLLPVFNFQRVEGLFSGQIRSRIVVDHEGFAWIGTLYGLARFNGYAIRNYTRDPADPHSLPINIVDALCLDRKGRLWVGTYGDGVCLYDRLNDRFLRVPLRPEDSAWYRAKSVISLLEDRSGNIWVGSQQGGVVRIELPPLVDHALPDTLTGALFTGFPLGTPRNSALDLCETDDGEILVASDSGLLRLDPSTKTVTRFAPSPGPAHHLDTTLITCLRHDSRGNLWVGTKTAGLTLLAGGAGQASTFRHRDSDLSSLSSDEVLSVAEDPSGNMWVSTTEGLDYFAPGPGERIPYLVAGAGPVGPTWLMELTVDRAGCLWVGTIGGVYRLSPRTRAIPKYGVASRGGRSPVSFETLERDRSGNLWVSSVGNIYRMDPGSMTLLQTIDVFRGRRPTYGDLATFVDRRGVFWYGSWGLGLFRIDLGAGTVRGYGAGTGLGSGLIANGIAQAGGDSLWVATSGEGLMVFDPGVGRFVRLPGYPRGSVWKVYTDSRRRLWIMSQIEGISVADRAAGKLWNFRHDPADPRSLASDQGRVMYEDPSGRIWVGAGNVVHLWDEKTRSFTRYPNPALPHALFAQPIGSDREGKIWVDYLPAGLSVLDPESGTYRNFDWSSGISRNVNEFESLDDGRVLVTTDEGLHLFHPDSLTPRRPAPALVISRMTVNDRPVQRPGLTGKPAPVYLTHEKNVLEFEFAALDLDAPHLVRYRYRLEGLEETWVEPENRRYVRYPGLGPGDYVFRVRAASFENEWPEPEFALPVRISPPWWRTWWAYAVWSLVAVGMVYGGVRLRLKQLELKQKARMEHMEADRLIELDRLKSRFFANISHEFRTPLTLIVGHLAKWKDDAPAAELRRDLTVAERNAHRLLRLINQLLDLSRLDAGAMKLRAANTNIVPVVKGIANSFESSAGMRGIALNVNAHADAVEIYCDRDMLEKILGNLLSNAFKFTPRGGSVSVSVAVTPAPPTAAAHGAGRAGPGDSSGDADPFREGYAEIVVSDTGQGIPAGELERVFDRFYQVDASQTREHEGSGIGLALVKELVDLHRGTIGVTSEEGKGATFTVRLPRGRGHLRDDQITGGAGASPPSGAVEAEPLEDAVPEPGAEARGKRSGARAEEAAGPGSPARPAGGRRPTVLVVEDNQDVREYIKGFLFADFEVHEACDGAEGVERAVEIVPDLVISDVMMPKKDGFELCRTLKLDERTNHVPIMLLTARAGVDNKVEGLETGADDYVVKPFEPKELLARARNLIAVRRALREKFTAAVTLRPGEIAVPSMDDAFLTRVREAVERHMGEEGFSVEDLSREAGLSRSQLLRKLTMLTGMSARDFIRYLRLQRGMDLLRQNAATVSEIAYMVGFGSPAHFTKCFHEQFGITPSEARGTRP